MARKPLSSTRAAALPQSSPGAWGDVRTASAWSRGGRTRPPRPPGSRKAAGGRGRMKTQVSGLPSFLNETLQTAVSWHQWAGPPELGCEGWKRRRRAPHRLPRPGQGPGRAGQSAGGDAVQRPQRGGGATRPPPGHSGDRGCRTRGGRRPHAAPTPRSGRRHRGRRSRHGPGPAPRGERRGSAGRRPAGALCTQGGPRGGAEGGTLQGKPYTGARRREDTGRQQAAQEFWPVTPHSSSCGPGQSAS